MTRINYADDGITVCRKVQELMPPDAFGLRFKSSATFSGIHPNVRVEVKAQHLPTDAPMRNYVLQIPASLRLWDEAETIITQWIQRIQKEVKDHETFAFSDRFHRGKTPNPTRDRGQDYGGHSQHCI